MYLNGLRYVLTASVWVPCLALLLTAQSAVAARPAVTDEGHGYIVELSQPGLIKAPLNAGVSQILSRPKTGSLDQDPVLKNYRQQLAEQRAEVLLDASLQMGRELQVGHIYSALLNGFSTTMTGPEAQAMAALPGVSSVQPVQLLELHLDTGPGYIGAPAVWNGVTGPASRGEGIVMGIIDSGINWDHPFFAETAEDGFSHSNPLGQTFGLCGNAQFPEVQCNAKLIGVYDFTDEAEQNGFDSAGHGSHVASIAAGNPLTRTLGIGAAQQPVEFNLSGVAPRANIISYKVCLNTSPDDPNAQPGCPTNAILAALDQALLDGVDMVNLSLGADVPPGFTPWLNGFVNQPLLDLRDAGILAVTSAGNSGPLPGSVTAPAHSPWVMAAGNITHDRVFGNPLVGLSGGNTAAPQGVFGAGTSNGTASLRIVHAGDFGNALCGTGPAESGRACNDNTGASNPFPPGTFNGEIVVCDRGIYGRVEKGFNLAQAGAGGYILANTDSTDDSVIDDDHCLPGIHVNDQAGDALRGWLNSGNNHQGRIGNFARSNIPQAGARVVGSSSRGPNLEIPGVLKPNVVAPGTNIIGALNIDDQFQSISGTSMSSPHLLGAAALLMAVRPDWNIAQVISALETTAVWPVPGTTPDPASGSNERGAGVINAGQAVRAGLFLPVTGSDFRAADPAAGGNPEALNLSGVQLAGCINQCSTTRTLQDQMGGGNWQLSTDQDFLSVTPASFSVGANQSRSITIRAELNNPDLVGEWRSANVIMTSDSASDGQPLTQRLPVAVFFSGGNLPLGLQITTSQTRGNINTTLNNLVAMQDATWQTSRLIAPQLSTGVIAQDPTRNDPYDSNIGRRVQFVNVPEGTLRLRAETLASSAEDVDLYVGQDLNGNNQPDPFEELCASLSTNDLEQCELDLPAAGRYWILVQNWIASPSGSDNVRHLTGILSMPSGNTDPNLFINAPAQLENNADADITIAWDAGTMQQGDTYWGAAALGTSRENPGNVGVFSILVARDAPQVNQTLPLFDGIARDISLAGNSEQNLTFIDVPDNATQLEVLITGQDIELQAVRVPFNQAFANQPLVAAAPQSRPFSVAPGTDGMLTLTISGAQLLPGRWYLIPRNVAAQERSFNIIAALDFDDDNVVTPRETAYARDGGSTRQGIDFGRVGSFYGALWFTFDDNGDPMFFGSSAPVPSGGDRTFSGLLRTPVSDGNRQQQQAAGRVGVTILNEGELIYSYDLLGESGSELMSFLVNTTCPVTSGGVLNVNGVWDIPPVGQGGVSMAVTQTAQGYLRYFFDDFGQARWVSARADGSFAQNPAGTVFQASGFCPLCPPVPTSIAVVGAYGHAFSSDAQGTHTIDFTLRPPLSGGLDESVAISKLSDAVECR